MEDGKNTVRAVERALDILLVFIDQAELGLTEIADKVKLHKSTVYRLLASLEGKGFLIRDASTEKYRLGFRIWELSLQLAGRADDLGTLLLPEMESLRDAVGETISLYIREQDERIRIQAVQSNQEIRRVAAIGARLPLYVGASSKIFLAFEEDHVQQEIMHHPSWPITADHAKILSQLVDIKQSGYATSIEEREPGAAAVAAPIKSRSGRLVAALAVSGPSNRLHLQRMREIAPQVIAAAQRMGKMIQ